MPVTAFEPTELREVFEVVPARFGDVRGWFSEVYNRAAFSAAGIETDWVQDNQSFSAVAGTVRGLHYQAPPAAQDKLVRVVVGAIFDVVVDIRRGSPTYGKWAARELSVDKGNQLFVPAGFAHGFMTLVPDTHVLYKVNTGWSKDHEGAIRWDDPVIAIAWPDIGSAPILSDKDLAAPLFADLVSPFSFRA